MLTRISTWFVCIGIACTATASAQSSATQNSSFGPSPTAQQWTLSSYGSAGPQAVQQTPGASEPVATSVTAAVPGTPAATAGGHAADCGAGTACFGYDPNCPTRYFSLFGGVASFPDIDYSVDLGVGPNSLGGDLLLDLDTGWALGGAIGRSLGRNTRAELEFTYRSASVVGGSAASGGQTLGPIPLDGSLDMYSFMPNFLYDFRPNSRFNPYVGFGLGVVFQELEVIEPTSQLNLNIQDSAFAYQGIAGVSTCLSARTDLFVEYRFFGTDQFSVDLTSPTGNLNFSTDTTSNNVLFGLRIKRW